MERAPANKRRLHFGVIFPSLDNTEKYDLLQGIEEYANKNDIHLTAFFGTFEAMVHEFASNYAPCFELIKRSAMLDGIVVYSAFIAHNIGTELFMANIKRISKKIPVVSIGLSIPGAYSVMADNVTSMYNAVTHLIKEHGKKRIAFIKGPDGHPEAEERLEGYLKALKDNRIKRDDALILPGNWTPRSGVDAVVELLEIRKIEFDAIATTDDDSALFAIVALKNRGYKVPGQIAVTGFNDIDEAADASPALSTIRQDFSNYGALAAEALHRVIKGEKLETVTYTVPELIVRRSCGCSKKPKRRKRLLDYGYQVGMRRRMVTDNLLLQFNLESLANTMRGSFSMVNVDFTAIGVYNANTWNDAGRSRSIETLFGYDGDKRFFADNLGERSYPFADFHKIKGVDFERTRRTLFFLPLFFGDEESGEALITYNTRNPINWYENVRRNIAVAVKGASLLTRIEALSITDELTGLLNRRGFFRDVYARITYLQRQTENLPVVFALDMDGLKYINDTYGHAEGDVAIKAFADILRESVRMEDIIGRLGGDEFVIFSVVKAENDIGKLETRIRQKLAEYNVLEKHPYTIGGSIGSAALSAPTNAAYEQAMLDADNALYAEKQEKRKKGVARI